MTDLKNFIVDIASLKDGKSYEENYIIDKSFFKHMENDEIIDADVDVQISIEPRHSAYNCIISCNGSLFVPCDRCLDPVEIAVDTQYDMIIKYGDIADDSADNILVIPYNQTRFDFAPVIYDTLLLEIPLRKVHPQGMCNPEMSEKFNSLKIDDEPENDHLD